MALLPSLFGAVAKENLGEAAGEVSKVWEPVLEQAQAATGKEGVMLTTVLILLTLYLGCGITLVLADFLYRGVIFRDWDDLLEAFMIAVLWGPLVVGLVVDSIKRRLK